VTGLPLVLTHHSMNTWRPPWQRALGDWADHQADVVIAVATNVASTISSPRVEIIPNGVNSKPEVWSPAEVAAARQKLAVPTDAYLLSYVGRLTTDKNPVRFVEIAGRVAPECPEAHFVLMGDGPLYTAAAARARALGIEGRVTFAGFVPGAGRLHQVADVLMLTSDSEGSPLAVLDAMAAGRPVIATAVGDVPEQVVDGETGYISPPNDLEGLANAVLALRDPALRAQFGAAGRKRAHELFSIDHMLDRTVAVYREALARRAPR
jgi:glycosyltransferase involved in cell wall biosynthesis